jgi:hypothetical protein
MVLYINKNVTKGKDDKSVVKNLGSPNAER